MTAPRVCVDSTYLAAVTFLPDHNVLEVEFRNGLTYEYVGVPLALYQQLLAAPSKGSFLNRFVRKCFPYRRADAKKMTQ